jgi:hypothetical protein
MSLSAVSPLSAAIRVARAWRTCAARVGPVRHRRYWRRRRRRQRRRECAGLFVDSVHVSEASVEASPALAALFTKIYALQNAAIQIERSSDGTLFLVELAEGFRGKRTFTALATYSPFGHVMWKEALFGAKVPEEHLCMGSLHGCGHIADNILAQQFRRARICGVRPPRRYCTSLGLP